MSQEDFDNWRKWRNERLLQPLGNLALIETKWLSDGETLTLEEAQANRPATVMVTEISRKNVVTGETENGFRWWDSNSEGIQSFAGVKSFPYNANAVLTGQFHKAPSGRTIPFEYLHDGRLTRDLVVPGDIAITIAESEYNLSAFDDDGQLLLVFGDLTNRDTHPELCTYGSGRFLIVQWAPGANSEIGGEVILDFNQAFIPPCGFSDAYNCPLPPAQNRINTLIQAGEIHILTK